MDEPDVWRVEGNGEIKSEDIGLSAAPRRENANRFGESLIATLPVATGADAVEGVSAPANKDVGDDEAGAIG